MTNGSSGHVGRAEFYTVMTVIFVALVAIHHSQRAPSWVGQVLTALLIAGGLVSAGIAMRSFRR